MATKMATSDKMMTQSEITNMLKDSSDDDADTKRIRGLIRGVYDAFFGSSTAMSDDDKKILLSKLTSGYGGVDENIYPYFRSADTNINSIHTALTGPVDDSTDV
jgi:hypothetical protein